MYLITTSRPYTNAQPHIGTAIDAIWGDTFNRFFGRLHNGNTFFTMGTDEHSFKIADKAKELGIAPKEFVDEKYDEFKQFYDSLDIVADDFIQSSNPKHYWLSNLVWDKLENKNLIYKKTYQGLYCKGCEDFYSPSQLIDGHCPIHTNLGIQHVDEENYFFRLSAFKDELLEYLGQVKVPDKSVLVEMNNFVENLEDISISRDRSRLSVDWGIPVLKHPEHIMYVWFEALLTYLTPMVDDDTWSEWKNTENEQYQTPEQALDTKLTVSDPASQATGVFDSNKSESEEKVWAQLKHQLPQNLQIIGRDNAKFHLVIYPAILSGLELPKIEQCLVHGMINDTQGRKFAKSLGNGFEISEYIQKFGTEGVRFFVLHDVNTIGDTSFDWQRATESYNANLADNLGNLVVRVTNLIEKNLSGFVDLDDVNSEELVDLNTVYGELLHLNTQGGMQKLLLQCTKINQYLEEKRPWELVKGLPKTEPEIKHILSLSAKSLLEISKVLAIFLPQTGEKIYEILTADRIEKAPILFPKVEM